MVAAWRSAAAAAKQGAMKKLPVALVLPLPFLAGGCLMLPVVDDPVYSTCHAVGSSGWSAHVERIPDHHNRPILKPWLIVSGQVTVPSDGYSVSLDLGPVRKLDAPVQQIMVRTEPARDVAAQVLTNVEVRGAFPALKHYGAVTIRCGDGTMAIIKPIVRTS